MAQEKRGLSGNQLKLIAVVSMILDHAAVTVFSGNSFLREGTGAAAAVPFLRTAGRLAFPLFAFLLAEGAFYTRDWKKYAARLGVCAVLSELPFDWMSALMSGRNILPGLQSQNVLFTLLFGLFMARGLLRLERRTGPAGEAKSLVQTAWIGLWAALAQVLRCDYGAYGLVLIGIFCVFRWRRRTACLLGFFWMGVTCAGLRCWYYWAGYAAAFALISVYHGTRSRRAAAGGFCRIAWYGIYPAHMALLCALRQWVLR